MQVAPSWLYCALLRDGLLAGIAYRVLGDDKPAGVAAKAMHAAVVAPGTYAAQAPLAVAAPGEAPVAAVVQHPEPWWAVQAGHVLGDDVADTALGNHVVELALGAGWVGDVHVLPFLVGGLVEL